MLKSKHAVLAAAVMAAWSVAPVFGQTTSSSVVVGPVAVQGSTNDKPEERASAVIRVIDAPTPAAQAVPIDTAELRRARAAGDMAAGERGEPVRIERIRIDDPVKPGAGSSAAQVVQVRSDDVQQPQIVRAEGESKGRTGAVVRLDDAARYRETAKYEAERKQRATEKASVASEQATARPTEAQATARTTEAQTTARITEPQRTTEPEVTVMGSAQGRAEITWSAPEREAPQVVVIESPQETLRN